MRRLAPGLIVVLAACGGPGPGDAGPPKSQVDARMPGTPVPRPSGVTDEAFERALFDEVVKADARASEEIDKEFPMLDPGAPGFNEDKFRKQTNKRRAAREALATKFRAQIAERNGMTLEALEELVARGRAKGWAPATPKPF